MKNMKILIDSNIILDVLENRQQFVKFSSYIWKLCELKKVDGYLSVLTFANLVDIMRKELTPKDINDVLCKLSLIFSLVDLTSADLMSASKLYWNDFEDAIQSITATKMNVDYIVTRNIKDFHQSKVKAITPDEFIKIFNIF